MLQQHSLLVPPFLLRLLARHPLLSFHLVYILWISSYQPSCPNRVRVSLSPAGLAQHSRLLVLKRGLLFYYSKVPKDYSNNPDDLEREGYLPKSFIEVKNLKKAEIKPKLPSQLVLDFNQAHLHNQDLIRKTILQQEYQQPNKDISNSLQQWIFQFENEAVAKTWLAVIQSILGDRRMSMTKRSSLALARESLTEWTAMIMKKKAEEAPIPEEDEMDGEEIIRQQIKQQEDKKAEASLVSLASSIVHQLEQGSPPRKQPNTQPIQKQQRSKPPSPQRQPSPSPQPQPQSKSKSPANNEQKVHFPTYPSITIIQPKPSLTDMRWSDPREVPSTRLYQSQRIAATLLLAALPGIDNSTRHIYSHGLKLTICKDARTRTQLRALHWMSVQLPQQLKYCTVPFTILLELHLASCLVTPDLQMLSKRDEKLTTTCRLINDCVFDLLGQDQKPVLHLKEVRMSKHMVIPHKPYPSYKELSIATAPVDPRFLLPLLQEHGEMEEAFFWAKHCGLYLNQAQLIELSRGNSKPPSMQASLPTNLIFQFFLEQETGLTLDKSTGVASWRIVSKLPLIQQRSDADRHPQIINRDEAAADWHLEHSNFKEALSNIDRRDPTRITIYAKTLEQQLESPAAFLQTAQEFKQFVGEVTGARGGLMVRALQIIGRYSLRAADLQLAEQCFEQGLKITMDWGQKAELIQDLGQVLKEKGMSDQALTLVQKTIKECPFDRNLQVRIKLAELTLVHGIKYHHLAAELLTELPLLKGKLEVLHLQAFQAQLAAHKKHELPHLATSLWQASRQSRDEFCVITSIVVKLFAKDFEPKKILTILARVDKLKGDVELEEESVEKMWHGLVEVERGQAGRGDCLKVLGGVKEAATQALQEVLSEMQQ